MKKIIYLLLFLCFAAPVLAQNSTAPKIANVRVANDFRGANIGVKIQAADTACGSGDCEIWVYGTSSAISTTVTIQAQHFLRFLRGAKVVKSGSGAIVFQGFGVVDPASQVPSFSGFAAGNITWTGTVYPKILSSNLWDDVVLSTRLAKAIGSMSGKQVTIDAYPGDIATKVTVTSGISLHMTRGTYTASNNSNASFILQSNTRFYGDGQGQTFLTESPNQPDYIRASGQENYNYDGYNENIEVSDLTFLGNPLTLQSSSASAISLGNVKGGYIRRNTFDHTHGFGSYVGGHATAGYTADGFEIVDNTYIGLHTQNAGTVGGRNGLISRNVFIMSTSPVGPGAIAIDIEPNADSNGSENIQITDNIIDARLAQSSVNGITVQQGYGSYMRNIRVSGNQIYGFNNSVVAFRPADVNITTGTPANTITAYRHGFQTGQIVHITADDGGAGNAIPGGLPSDGWVINTSTDTLKIASSYANAIAGTGVAITSTGAYPYYLLVPGRYLANGIQVILTDSSVIENNHIVGASQHGIFIQESYKLTVRNNTSSGTGIAGSNVGMGLFNVVDSDIIDNTLNLSPQFISQDNTIVETDTPLAVSATAGSPIVTVTGGITPMPYWYRGMTITINGADYVIAHRTGTPASQSLILTTNAASNFTGNATLKGSSNRYRGNKAGGTMLVATGTSQILTTFDDTTFTEVSDTAYAATANSGIIIYKTLTAPRTVTLPTAVGLKGKEIVIKDGAGAAAAQNITIATTGGQTIDGSATYVLSTNWKSVRLKSNGANWVTMP